MKKIAFLLILALIIGCLGFACAEEPTIYESGDYKYTLLADGTAEIYGYWGEEPEVVIPSEIDGYPVTSIGDNAFFARTHVTKITLPEGITRIGESAFCSCSLLAEINIPDSVSAMGEDNPVQYCFSLTNIAVAPDHPVFEVRDGMLINKLEQKLIAHPPYDQESVTVPEGILAIGNIAYYSAANLTEATLPEGLLSIGYCAFGDIAALAKVSIPESVTFIDETAFDTSDTLTITAAEGSYAAGYAAAKGIACVN